MDLWESTAGSVDKDQRYGCCWFSKKTIFPQLSRFEDSWIKSRQPPQSLLLSSYPSQCDERQLSKSGQWLQFQPHQQLHNNFSLPALITEKVKCSTMQSTDLGLEMHSLKTQVVWSPCLPDSLDSSEGNKNLFYCVTIFSSPSSELKVKQRDFGLKSFENTGMAVEL